MMKKAEFINLELPVQYVVEKDENNEYHIIYNPSKAVDDTGRALLDIGLVVQGETKEEAIQHFWEVVQMHIDYMEKRARQADKWEPFRRGPKGSNWFQIFGINFHFRYGDGMKGGWYIPFTKQNISIHSYWKKRKHGKSKSTGDS